MTTNEMTKQDFESMEAVEPLVEVLKDELPGLQKLIDKLRETELRQYIDSHTLGSVDSRYEVIDKLLQMGALK